MSQPLPIHSASSSSRSATPPVPFHSFPQSSSNFSNSLSLGFGLSFSPQFSSVSWVCSRGIGGTVPALRALRQQGSLHLRDFHDSLVYVQLQPISSETQFDRLIAEAQQLEDAVIVVWTASWCRKCIYLKPKLEKLAAEYYPRLRFFSVDVNTVSHKLVARAGVSKMPTIQLWKDSRKQAEVIGGHKAYLVINDVQQMIENECTI